MSKIKIVLLTAASKEKIIKKLLHILDFGPAMFKVTESSFKTKHDLSLKCVYKKPVLTKSENDGIYSKRL